MSTYYKECFVEQVYHYDALQNWETLTPGDVVKFEYDDSLNKVKVNKEAICIGVLSDDDSKSMLPFLKAGWENVFSGKFCLKSDADAEDKRIKIVIYIEPKEG